jgi:hypothetical protein
LYGVFVEVDDGGAAKKEAAAKKAERDAAGPKNRA